MTAQVSELLPFTMGAWIAFLASGFGLVQSQDLENPVAGIWKMSLRRKTALSLPQSLKEVTKYN